jgi:microcompartment protein CcmL/EutN
MISSYFMPGAHPGVLNYFGHGDKSAPGLPEEPKPAEAVGIFETKSISSGFVSLDAALKNGRTEILKIWMGRFIGGKFCWLLGGEVSEVSSALKAAGRAVTGRETAGSELIPRPDASTIAFLMSPNATAPRVE